MFLLFYLSYFKRKYHIEKRVYTKFHTPIVQVFFGGALSCYVIFSNRQSMKMERYNLRVKFHLNTTPKIGRIYHTSRDLTCMNLLERMYKESG